MSKKASQHVLCSAYMAELPRPDVVAEQRTAYAATIRNRMMTHPDESYRKFFSRDDTVVKKIFDNVAISLLAKNRHELRKTINKQIEEYRTSANLKVREALYGEIDEEKLIKYFTPKQQDDNDTATQSTLVDRDEEVTVARYLVTKLDALFENKTANSDQFDPDQPFPSYSPLNIRRQAASLSTQLFTAVNGQAQTAPQTLRERLRMIEAMTRETFDTMHPVAAEIPKTPSEPERKSIQTVQKNIVGSLTDIDAILNGGEALEEPPKREVKTTPVVILNRLDVLLEEVDQQLSA